MAENLDLYFAVKAGDLSDVERLLSQGHDIGEVNPKTGINSLHLAVLTGNYDIVELLSRDEAHINSACSLLRSGCGDYTPLHFSVDLCNKDITKLLLSRKANVNKQNKNGNTALHVAATNGIFLKTTTFFLLNGDIVYSKNIKSLVRSINKRATMYGYCEISDILLQSGANAQLVNGNGETALHLACRLKHDNMARIILKKCSSIVNYKNEDGRSALHIAVNSCYDWELVKLLIEYNVDIDATDISGSTPLYYACMERKLDVVQILVENGCNVNIGGDDKPINIAFSNCDEKIIKVLLEHGADTSHLDAFSFFSVLLLKEMDYEKYLFENCCKVFFKTDVEIFGNYKNCKIVTSNCIISCFEVFKLLLKYGYFKNIERGNEYYYHRYTVDSRFVKYVINMKMLGNFFARDYPDIDASNINLLPDEKIYEENCKKEVEILRGIFVCSGISLLDYLKKDLNKMVRLLKNQGIVNVLECLNCKILPIYGDLIKTFFKLGMERRSMLNRSYECFNVIFCQFPKLPDMVIETIFDLFTADDLKFFIAI